MRTSDFDFDLPDDRIARTPLPERDASRLLVLPLAGGPVEDRVFRDLPSLLRPGDLLVLNDARVIHARLRGTKEETGGRVELLLAEPRPPVDGRAVWRAMAGSSKPLRIGGHVVLGEGALRAEVVGVAGEGFVDVAFDRDPEALLEAVERIGELPLPPYLNRPPEPEDDLRYQTVFARNPGAVAAPTAGLHFTDAVFAALAERGVTTATVTLYVGPGTFLPVRGEDVSAHKMHAERYEIPAATAEAVARTRAAGGRVIAVGTTSLRSLEAAAREDGTVPAGPGCTDIFIYPGYRFRAIDGLVTNFHLPRSTLVMLVAALAGRERLLDAYRHAVETGYRFYSYGDAMLVV